MKTILLFGAGKSATVLIDYLIEQSAANHWQVIIADASRDVITAKTKNAACTTAVAIDVTDNAQRSALIDRADIVISMMPPALHFLIAKDCLAFGRHLLTASYVDDNLRSLQKDIEAKGLLFLCEMGLDPGIDHMSAMKIIDNIKARGGEVTSFKSHCGGLVAPESDDNPWHYKISWNPRNIVLAGKAGAIYKSGGNIVKENYTELFDTERAVLINEELGMLNYYPNRDSLSYIDIYGLHEAATFLRTTLRYRDFMYGWNNIIELQLTDETPAYESDGMSLATFFKAHFAKVNFSQWVNRKLEERLGFAKDLTEEIMKLSEAEDAYNETNTGNNDTEPVNGLAVVDENGELQQLDVEEIKLRAAQSISHKMHEANQTLKQLMFLGLDDNTTLINKGFCSAADALQVALEKKLMLQPEDKDMIVMLHEFEYHINGKPGALKSSLVVKGEDSLRTAMAKTVGLPLGIAAKLILNGTINLTGLHIPIAKDIYDPVLKELEENGINFLEE